MFELTWRTRTHTPDTCAVWQLHNHWPLLCSVVVELNLTFSKQTNTIKQLSFTCCRMWWRILTHFSIRSVVMFQWSIDLRLDVNFEPCFAGNKHSGPVVFIYIRLMTSLIINNLFFTFSYNGSTDDTFSKPVVGNTKYLFECLLKCIVLYFYHFCHNVW